METRQSKRTKLLMCNQVTPSPNKLKRSQPSSYRKRINEVANESTCGFWMTEDTDYASNLDLSLWMEDSNDSPTSVPIDFEKEWAWVERPLHDDDTSMDSTNSVASIRSVDSIDSTDSLMFSGDMYIENVIQESEGLGFDSLWCHETQVEDVSGHSINLSQLSILDHLAKKHEQVGGTPSLKIHIAGGIIGQRICYRQDKEGKPLPFYVNCAKSAQF